MAASAISCAVTRRCGDMDGVWTDPVTARVMMTVRLLSVATAHSLFIVLGKDAARPAQHRLVHHLALEEGSSLVAETGQQSFGPCHLLARRAEGGTDRLDLRGMNAELAGKAKLGGFLAVAARDLRVGEFDGD